VIHGRGADVEIWEPITKPGYELGVIKPYRIKINGVEVLTRDVPIVISDISKRDALSIKLELFVGSLKIHSVPPEDEPAPTRHTVEEFMDWLAKLWDQRDA
jgi:hypothetical protein